MPAKMARLQDASGIHVDTMSSGQMEGEADDRALESIPGDADDLGG